MTYYFFLRAVNIGHSTKVDMSLLKSYIKQQYDISIETYKNSGNIISRDTNNHKKLQIVIEESISNLFKLEIAVFGILKDELKNYFETNPFIGNEYNKAKTVLYFAEEVLKEDSVIELKGKKGIEEDILYNKKVLYVYYKNGIGRSKLTTAYIEKILNTRVTGRNVNTVEELLSKW